MSKAVAAARRADAVANRAALLDAAERVLLRDGPGTALDVVAREAGVGIATLYRNFASRDGLFAAVVHRSYELVAGLATNAEHSQEHPLDAVATFLNNVIDRRQHLVLPLLDAPPPQRRHIDPLGAQISNSLTAVLRRGIADGSIRADAIATDLIVAGAMLAHAQLPAEAWTSTARRIKAILLDGLRNRSDTDPLPPGLTRDQLDQAMTRPKR